MKAAFPVSPGEVDPAWLTDVLRANRLIAQGEKVDGFEATPIGLGFGQTGESARLTLRYARSETSTKSAGQPVREICHHRSGEAGKRPRRSASTRERSTSTTSW
jgi:hypothetical protein